MCVGVCVGGGGGGKKGCGGGFPSPPVDRRTNINEINGFCVIQLVHGRFCVIS